MILIELLWGNRQRAYAHFRYTGRSVWVCLVAWL